VTTGWHVDDEALRRYVQRIDSVAEGASVEQHVGACARCRARVNAAAGAAGLAVVDCRGQHCPARCVVSAVCRASRGA